MTNPGTSGKSGPERHPGAFERAVLAAVDGDIEALRGELDRAPDLITQVSTPPFEATLLHYAAAANGVEDELQRTPANAVEVVRLLLERGAEPDALGQGYGGGPNATPLCLLVSSWHPFEAGVQVDLVRVLVDGGARVNGLEDDGMPLATALVFGYTSAARALRDAGARVDSIFFAAGLGDLDLVRSFFTSEGVDVKAAQGTFPSPLLGVRDFTPHEVVQEALHFAVTHGELDVASFLLEQGASVNGVSRGHHCETPLAQAIFVSELEAARWLHERGADPDHVDGKRGVSPRSMAKGRINF